MGNMGDKHNSKHTATGNRIALSQIGTLHCQQKELEHKGGQKASP